MLIKEFSSYQTLLASQNDKSVKYWKIPNDTHYQETLNQGLTLPLRVTLSTTDGHLDIQISTSRYLLKCRLNILGCCWGWWPEAARSSLCSVYLFTFNFALRTFEWFITICRVCSNFDTRKGRTLCFPAFCARKLSLSASAPAHAPPGGSLAMAEFTSQVQTQHQGQ